MTAADEEHDGTIPADADLGAERTVDQIERFRPKDQPDGGQAEAFLSGEDSAVEHARADFPTNDPHFAQTRIFAAERGGESAARSSPSRFGNYELLGEIGRGGMGVVYRARQQAADRIVALKVIQRDQLKAVTGEMHTSAIDRFRKEVQVAARLEHEHIVTLYEVGEAEGNHFFLCSTSKARAWPNWSATDL
jgi:hypothetical protein